MSARSPGAAERTLNILTTWLRQHPDCAYATTISLVKEYPFRFQIITPAKTHNFKGTSVQDAQAQAAQAIVFEAL